MRSIVRIHLFAFTAAQFVLFAAHPALASERVTYKRNSDRDLLMTITKPPAWSANDHRSAIIFFFNGGWKSPGSTKPQFEEQARYFAARGMVVAQADYREKAKDGATSAKCVEDIFSAVRWLRSHAGELGLDPARIAAAGGSGSIHLPAAVFQTNDIVAPGENPALSPLPGALFIFHPDPDVLDAAMMDRILSGGALAPGKQMPPTVVYWGSRDGVAPFLADFVARTRTAGLPVESYVGEGGVHGFYKFTPGLEMTTDHMDKKLRTLGFLSDEPKVELPHKAAPADYEERILATQQQWLERHQQLAQERSAKATTTPAEKPGLSKPAISAAPPATYQKAEPRAEVSLPPEPGKGKTVATKGGKVTDSRLAGMLAKFPEADANKDGILTMEEAKAFKKKSKKPGYTASPEPAAAKPASSVAAVAPGVAPSKSWDTNGDGKISREEFKGPAQLFQNMDVDGDGFLSGAELKKLDQKLSLDKMDSATWVVPPSEKYHGVEHQTYFSKSMQTEVGFNIYLPDEYATSQKRYPVIYHLHGSGGNESAQVDLSEVYQRAITEHKMCPVIIVFANGGKRSYYSDGANGKILAETTIMRELIPHIDETYRTIPEKACRVIHGFSMGGFGAMKLGSKFPEQFCAMLSFGGGMAAPGSLHLDFLKQIVGDDERAIAANNPADLVIKNKDALSGMSWWLFTGTRDVAREDSTWAHEHLQKLGIPHRFEVSQDVGHTLKKHYALFGDDIFKMLQTHFATSAAFSKPTN